MNWIQGWDRKQWHLLPAEVESYVTAENPVRFLDAFVEGLDLRAVEVAQTNQRIWPIDAPPENLARLAHLTNIHEARAPVERGHRRAGR